MRFIDKLLAKWIVSSSTGMHLAFLDGLRGLAILIVVVAHGVYANPEGSRKLIALAHLAGTGALGVQMFFALSGFLISYPFFRNRTGRPVFTVSGGYVWRRVLKIFPPFYFAIVLLAFFHYWNRHDTAYFSLGLKWATGYAAVVDCPKYFNGSFWSLWVEIQFYLVLPVLFILLRKCSVRAAGWMIFALLLLVPAISRTIVWPRDPNVNLAFVLRQFPTALDGFAWGVLFAALFTLHPPTEGNRRWAGLGYAGLALLAGGMSAIACGTFGLHLNDAYRPLLELKKLVPGVACFLMMFFAYDARSPGSRFFSAPWLRFIGIVSFEWFLLHQPMQLFAREIAVSTQGNFLRYAVVVGAPSVLTLLAATVLYHYFSHPILVWGRERLEDSRLAAKQVSTLPGHENRARAD